MGQPSHEKLRGARTSPHLGAQQKAESLAPSNELRTNAAPPAVANSPYLCGDGAASSYLGLKDPQGRTFRKWAMRVGIPFTMVFNKRIYRRRDIDRAWARNAENIMTDPHSLFPENDC